jgi:hypothetical protein
MLGKRKQLVHGSLLNMIAQMAVSIREVVRFDLRNDKQVESGELTNNLSDCSSIIPLEKITRMGE